MGNFQMSTIETQCNVLRTDKNTVNLDYCCWEEINKYADILPGTKCLEIWALKYSGNFNHMCTSGSHFLEPFVAQAEDIQLTLPHNIQKYWKMVTWALLQ